jgi:uroporphyrinogen III methyltransferase / synthase
MNNNIPKGKVYLTGAGPGDPGLITVNGMQKVQEADVILYDNLASRQLLEFAKTGAEMIYVGKEAGNHSMSQEKIIELMIEKAKIQRKVVRLKGGDPLIFGRGSEEAIALKQAGIDFEIIPGVTAGIAAAAYAGIPLTHRALVTQCVFITGNESPDKEESQVDWPKLATLKNANLVVYMGVSQITALASILLRKGMDPNTDTAIIECATLPNQKTYFCKLSELSDKIYDFNLKPPVIFIIGPTVKLNVEMNWLLKKPLFGKRIVITRAKDQAADIFYKLKVLGANPIQFPVIKTEKSSLKKSLKMHLKTKYDWIIFSSENGVRYLFDLMKDEKIDARIFAGSKIAAIGTGTASMLSNYNIFPDFVPTEYTSEALIDEMNKKKLINGSLILRIKGDFERDLLIEKVREFDGKVNTLEVYKVMPDSPCIDDINDIRNYSAHAFLFMSMSTVNNFFKIIGENAAREMLNKTVVIAIGPVTATALKEKFVNNIIISEVHTIDGMIDELHRVF